MHNIQEHKYIHNVGLRIFHISFTFILVTFLIHTYSQQLTAI